MFKIVILKPFYTISQFTYFEIWTLHFGLLSTNLNYNSSFAISVSQPNTKLFQISNRFSCDTDRWTKSQHKGFDFRALIYEITTLLQEQRLYNIAVSYHKNSSQFSIVL